MSEATASLPVFVIVDADFFLAAACFLCDSLAFSGATNKTCSLDQSHLYIYTYRYIRRSLKNKLTFC